MQQTNPSMCDLLQTEKCGCHVAIMSGCPEKSLRREKSIKFQKKFLSTSKKRSETLEKT